MFVFRERDHAVTYVTGRQDSEFFAQASRATAIVGDGHNRGKVRVTFFQSAKKTGEARSATNRDNSWLARFHFSGGATSCLKSASSRRISKSVSRLARNRFSGRQ